VICVTVTWSASWMEWKQACKEAASENQMDGIRRISENSVY
ncbi:unnamed protein product, partial [marine sediment metagenome]